jgi:hypothetical protein
MGQLVVRGDYSRFGKWWTKIPAVFQEMFGIFRGIKNCAYSKFSEERWLEGKKTQTQTHTHIYMLCLCLPSDSSATPCILFVLPYFQNVYVAIYRNHYFDNIISQIQTECMQCAPLEGNQNSPGGVDMQKSINGKKPHEHPTFKRIWGNSRLNSDHNPQSSAQCDIVLDQ